MSIFHACGIKCNSVLVDHPRQFPFPSEVTHSVQIMTFNLHVMSFTVQVFDQKQLYIYSMYIFIYMLYLFIGATDLEGAD